uniref:translocation and assembly module lipoprotein TamL n=1 Tax=Deminuibacter soli TaxID=2291815 RepID=UPI00131485CB|nr:BamA/TamA family outer membrane protein [Deminuibacter soli]
MAAGCSTTKHVPDGDALYMGADVKLKGVNDSVKYDKKALRSELAGLVRPAPNKSFLGIKFKLLFYNWGGFVRRKLGEEPVLLSSVNVQKNSDVLQNRMENRGYFRSELSFDTTVKKKKGRITYNVTVYPQYVINSIKYPADSSDISKAIARQRRRALTRVGKPYDLDNIKNEYARIDERLKERGFYFFSPNYLLYDVDSSIGNHRLDMTLKIKPGTPVNATKIYRINDVLVYADYNLSADTTARRARQRAVKYDYYYIYDPHRKFNPKVFSRALIFKPGDPYNRKAHNLSLNRLVSLGVYRFVKARFQPVDTPGVYKLNTFYYLTPAPKKSLRFEVSGLTKSNNANGTDLTLSWRNRNFFKGAELFTASLYGGFEKQYAGQQKKINISRVGVDLNLLMPRVVGPVQFKTNGGFVPQTRINAGYELYNRTDQYTLSSAKASFGYIWRETITKEHQLNLISINYVKPTKIDSAFQKGLDTNITLARSIERQFIIGSNYNFNINTQAAPNRNRNNYYFNANVDLSGNVLGLLTGANVKAGKEKNIFGTPFSEYSRLEFDFRHYLRIGSRRSDNTLASRVLVGAGWSYGNSIALPFVKSFFAGGVNDIRAFRARSLGPGNYYGGNAAVVGYLPDQPGDIKILMSTELRARLISVLYGAVFADAGNIWLTHDDPTRPGGKFSSDFLDQFAVGTGVGLRVDIKFFVIRFDAAFPIRKPFVTTGSKWVINQVNFGDADWRKQNLVYNLAIGYPF